VATASPTGMASRVGSATGPTGVEPGPLGSQQQVHNGSCVEHTAHTHRHSGDHVDQFRQALLVRCGGTGAACIARRHRKATRVATQRTRERWPAQRDLLPTHVVGPGCLARQHDTDQLDTGLPTAAGREMPAPAVVGGRSPPGQAPMEPDPDTQPAVQPGGPCPGRPPSGRELTPHTGPTHPGTAVPYTPQPSGHPANRQLISP